jgi:hypothetical protein
MPPEILAERRQKERNSLDDFRRISERLGTMQDCHRWLFTSHAAYNALGPAFGPEVE